MGKLSVPHFQGMSKTVVMTLRLPAPVAKGVERLAARFGHKPSQLGARLVEEGLRRRDHPQIDLRETSAGRVAYIGGTRFAVYWVARTVRKRRDVAEFAQEYEVPVERVRAALAYAEAFPEEIEADAAHAEANLKWIEQQDAAWRGGRKANGKRHPKAKTKASQ